MPSFAALADRMHDPVDPRTAAARPVTYMVFDVLRLYGVALVDRPLAERRATLERLELAVGAEPRRCRPATPTAPALLEATRQRGMEGVRGQAPGQRLPARPAQPAVGEDHAPAHPGLPGRRLAPGAQQRRPDRRAAARLAGRAPGCATSGKVGAGLTGATAQRVLHERLVRRERPPFGERLPRPDGVGARWCEPLTVVEVGTPGLDGGRLRQPAPRQPGPLTAGIRERPERSARHQVGRSQG